MATLQHQIQLLADWSAGLLLKRRPDPDQFTVEALSTAWSHVCAVMWRGNPWTFREECFAELQAILARYPNGTRLFERIKATPPSNQQPFRSLAQLASTLHPVEWLWPGWLPRGVLTLLAGRQGAGKSILSLDIALRIMSATPWPDGVANERTPAPVIYADGESLPQVHNDRAAAWGLPRHMLYLLLPEDEDGLIDLGAAKYQWRLEQMVYRLRPGLVVVDSLGAVLARGENTVESVRAVLGYLALLAQQHNVAILVLHHLRKADESQLSARQAAYGPASSTAGIRLDQVRGSSHITAMARVVWGLTSVQTASQPAPLAPRRLEVIKSNLAVHPQPVGVTLSPLPGTKQIYLNYTDQAPEPYRPPTELDAIQDWLLDYLAAAGEPASPSAVIQAAREAGFPRTQLYRARARLEGVITNTAGFRAPGNRWQLASAVAPQDPPARQLYPVGES